MARVLIVFDTRYGQTGRLAAYLAGHLGAEGHETVRHSARDMLRGCVENVDAVVVAAPVYFSRHPRRVRSFVRRNLSALNRRPSAFVSVCGALAGDWPEGAREARGYVDAFLELTGWQPGLVLSVAGAIPYTRYGFFTRWFMRRFSSYTGRPVDASRDYEFTNWADVDRLATELSAMLATPAADRCCTLV